MITHPFHPRRGQSCLVLEVMRTGRDEILVVHTPDDVTLFIPVEWTDRACPAPENCAGGAVTRLEAPSLLKVVDIVRRFQGPSHREVDKC